MLFGLYQQKIEWVLLKEQHPDLFEQAKAYEEQSLLHGEAFNWEPARIARRAGTP